MKEFETNHPNTWCPGCPNSVILQAFKGVLANLVKDGISHHDLVAVTDIGCAGKFYDLLEVNGFYALHGRSLITAFGMKMANPKLKVVGFIGDGGAYAEGLNHLVQLARLNPDLTALVFNNRVFALTVGQGTPVTEEGYRGNTTPEGMIDPPYNPLAVALSAGAPFIARTSALDISASQKMIKQAIQHRGFSILEILQPCITFRPDDLVELRQNHKPVSAKKNNREEARQIIESWNYDQKGAIPVGVFYQANRPVWEERHKARTWHRSQRKVDMKKIKQELL